jgi:hypothetical protein
MKRGHAAALTSTLLFRKGGASSGDFFATRASGLLANSFRLAPDRPYNFDPGAPVRVSVKLDRSRRQHLRLAAAKLGLSNQELLASAVDHYLRRVVPAQIADPCCCLKTPASPETA